MSRYKVLSALPLIIMGCLSLAAPVRAELIVGSLQDRIRDAALILRCVTEVEGETVAYRVLETLKGEYRPTLFVHEPPDGYMKVMTFPHEKQRSLYRHGEKIIFFFEHDANQGKWRGKKFVAHSMSLSVEEGKVCYCTGTGIEVLVDPETGGATAQLAGERYTVDELRDLIQATTSAVK